MHKVKVVLGLAIVLSLLLAMAMPAYAGKQGPGKDKGKDPPAGGQDKPKKDKDKGGQQSNGGQGPTDTLDPDDPAEGAVTICHKPGTPAEKTLRLPESAVPGHLRHGDYEGECLDISPSPVPTDTQPITSTGTITICHKPGTPAEKTLVLPEAALQGHLRHGDYEGECLDISPSPVPTDTQPITSTGTITICHKPGTPAEKTLVLPKAAVPGHLRHGDELGACPETAPPSDSADTAVSASAPWGRHLRNRR